MDVFLARQPVFTEDKKVFGYELLFRLGLENFFPDVDGDKATSTLLSNIFFPFDYKEILGGKKGLINFTEKLLVQKAPLLLPKEHFIIEVLEEIEPEEELLASLQKLNDEGFNIALDDFVYHEKYEPMMALSKIIKFDLIATPLDSIEGILKEIRKKFSSKFLAEKVETYQEFELAKAMGFDLFQGYFFSKPEVLSTKGISSSQITKLRLVNEMGKEELNLESIESLIKKDVSISFKLLKFINSAYFSRPNPIDTIKDAINFLGTQELRKFINIVVISDIGEQKPNELVRVSIIRARMCEKCGELFKTKFSKEELFTLGLFSFIDAILDRRMEDIFQYVVFSEKMQRALCKKDKEFNSFLNLISSFEKGNWQTTFLSSISGRPEESKLAAFYLDSVKMANSFFLNNN